MRLVAIDSTAAVATAALFQDNALVAEREAIAGKKHAETLLPLIDDLLEENGVTIHDIDLFAVDIGPGSFTGVRIGVSLVNALAFATGKQIVAVDSLETLARSVGGDESPRLRDDRRAKRQRLRRAVSGWQDVDRTLPCRD